MTYEQAIDYVNSFLQFGIKPGLERIKFLLEMLGNPQKKLKFIHVAGTNGKGSTCTFISSILKASGLNTGLFISPFVLDFRERFQINGNMISKEEFVDVLEYIIPFAKKMPKNGNKLTEFELITVIALVWFERKNCDVVVLEVGLGGRLDATNVIDKALVSVITSISYDHMNILGTTISEIATEKAGILKPNGTLVLYPEQEKEAFLTVKNIAENLKNKIIIPDLNSLSNVKFDLGGTEFTYINETFEIKLLGEHQIYNAITAICAVREVANLGLKISDKNIKSGLMNAKFYSRLEIISKKPLVILDGAHNLAGAKALVEAIKLYFSKKRVVAIVGMLKDKEVTKVLRVVAPLVSGFIVVQPDNLRAMDKFELNELVKSFNAKSAVAEDLPSAVKLAFKKLYDDSVLLVFGSLYLASQIRPILLSFF